MAKLLNTAEANGMYDGVRIDDTTELTVELSALTITKEADKKIWYDGDLGYTITVTNIDVRTDPDDPDYPGLPVTDVVITDTIDPTVARLILASMTLTVGGVPVDPIDYDYDNDGLLTVRVPALTSGEEAILDFRVEKVP